MIEATRTGPTVRPRFIGRVSPVMDPRWSAPLLAIGEPTDIEPGAWLFRLDGAVIGLAVRGQDGITIAPASALEALTLRCPEESRERPRRDVRRRELGGQDPIDRRLGPPPSLATPLTSPFVAALAAADAVGARTGAVAHAGRDLSAARRAARAARRSAGSRRALLGRLDLAVTIALAVLGVLVGIALGREIRTARASCSSRPASRAS